MSNPETTGWKPIETAPRDGSRFVFWNGQTVGVGQFMGASGNLFGADSFHGMAGINPTHWHELPEPPHD